MANDGSQGILPEGKVEELAHLLEVGMFEEFMRAFKANAHEIQGEGPVTLADLVNKALLERDPKCDMKLVVSQKTSDKHLIMIMDNSRFWGDSWTITRQMFTV